MLWTIILAVGGFFIFSSASLGILAQNPLKFSSVAFSQLFLGLFLGSIACVLTARIDYRIWKKFSIFIFIFSILLTLLVFVPQLSHSHGGASRWIDLGFITFQPSELLKLGFVIYFSAWAAAFKQKIATFRWGLLPFLVLTAIVGVVLLAQPDTDTFAVIVFSALAMYIAAGAKWNHVLSILIIGAVCLASLAFMRPYVMQRITSMLRPAENTLTTSYQLRQSLIAIGSGEVWGRGFGQSVQKFHYLPEPVGDSVFAVAAEEFGFAGGLFIILAFVLFGLYGLKIASGAPDEFGRLLSIGIVILIVSQAFVNIGGMIGVLPLTGIPLPFISHGGTALFITLLEVGIVMNISRQTKIIKQK